jgi:hypothetical protein
MNSFSLPEITPLVVLRFFNVSVFTTRTLRLAALSSYAFLKQNCEKKNRNSNIFKMRRIFPVVIKPQRDEGGGRILLGDNPGGGTDMLPCCLVYRKDLTTCLLNSDLRVTLWNVQTVALLCGASVQI